jgi:DNA-binding CsgD family transcriptional regulator
MRDGSMKIGTYQLTSVEENRVLIIYENLKQAFPRIRIDCRKEIIGIGEEGRYLMCYFSLKENAVFVKFKNRTWINLNDFQAIQNDIDLTKDLFKNEELIIKKKSEATDSVIYISSESCFDDTYAYMREDFLCYTKAIELIPQNKTDTSFDSCSKRLKNALYRNHKFTVKDLLTLTPVQIMKIPNLGCKCFRELCDFLLALSNNEKNFNNNSPPPIQTEQKLQKIKFINDNRRKINIDLNDAVADFNEDMEIYNTLYFDLINHIYETTIIKLRPRERAIILSRFGINERAKTLQEIAVMHSITRERVRQLVLKAMQKMGYKHTSTNELLDLEYRKIEIVCKIAELSAGKFLSFLFLEEVSFWLIKFICQFYFRCELDVAKFKLALDDQVFVKKQQDKNLEKSRLYNESINRLIIFPQKKRRITEDDFARLKTERIVKSEEDDLKFYSFDGITYQCESYLEQRMLHRFLTNQTFKSIKTQSLKIPVQDHFYHPDFQCLTHDNCLVLIEIKPLLNMCEYDNIEKFEVLKNYCEKYGFGFLIIDERGNSFEHINEENCEFSKSVLAEINEHGHIAYYQYKKIVTQYNATVKNLIALIKNYNLHFSFPFLIKK